VSRATLKEWEINEAQPPFFSQCLLQKNAQHDLLIDTESQLQKSARPAAASQAGKSDGWRELILLGFNIDQALLSGPELPDRSSRMQARPTDLALSLQVLRQTLGLAN
jgi:hypothetical protein